MSWRKTGKLSHLTQYLLFGGLLFAVGFVGFRAAQATIDRIKIAQEVKLLQTQLDALRQQSGALRSAIHNLDRPEALEQEARKRLNVSKEGERTIVLVPQGERAAVTSISENQSVQPKEYVTQEPSNPVRWWYRFFGQ